MKNNISRSILTSLLIGFFIVGCQPAGAPEQGEEIQSLETEVVVDVTRSWTPICSGKP